MKNNKGFSLVELIVSFTLTMVIVVILFEIIVSMKDLYVSSVTKTELLNKQSIYTDYIYSDIDEYGLNNISICGDNCIGFEFTNGQIKKLEWSFYSAENINQSLQSLSYGDYKINLINNAYFDTKLSISNGTNTLTGVKICNNPVGNKYININLPIYHTMFQNENFGINLLYVYDDLGVDLPLTSGC